MLFGPTTMCLVFGLVSVLACGLCARRFLCTIDCSSIGLLRFCARKRATTSTTSIRTSTKWSKLTKPICLSALKRIGEQMRARWRTLRQRKTRNQAATQATKTRLCSEKQIELLMILIFAITVISFSLALKALAMNDRWTTFVVFFFRHPHLYNFDRTALRFVELNLKNNKKMQLNVKPVETLTMMQESSRQSY